MFDTCVALDLSSGAFTQAHADVNGKGSIKRSASEGNGGFFRHFRRSGSGSHKPADLDMATSDAPNGDCSSFTELHHCMIMVYLGCG